MSNADETASALYETEAEMARERIASRVDELQERLNPRTVMRQAFTSSLGTAQDRGMEAFGELTRWARENQTLVIGASAAALGATLLYALRDRFGDDDDDIYAGYGEVREEYGMEDYRDERGSTAASTHGWSSVRGGTTGGTATATYEGAGGYRGEDRDQGPGLRDKLGARAASLKQSAGETWSSTRQRTGESLQTARQRTTEYTQKSKEWTQRSLNESPMTAVIVGFAAGAILGALLPRTQRENELLGETRDQLAEKAKAAAQTAIDAGKERLDEMGINADAAKAKLSEFAAQAKDVAKDVGQTAAERAKAQVSNDGGQSMSGTQMAAATGSGESSFGGMSAGADATGTADSSTGTFKA